MRGARARRYAAGAGSAQICLMPSAGPGFNPCVLERQRATQRRGSVLFSAGW